MSFRICSLLCLFAAFSFPTSLCDSSCPALTASFPIVLDQAIDGAIIITNDMEQTFFKEVMGFRDNDIQNAFANAVTFFNERFGLDFSTSQPNERNEYVFGNATMIFFTFPEDVNFQVVLSNWIQTGNTRVTCRDADFGGFFVTFSGDQILKGSYGGEEGALVGVGASVVYAYVRIDVCAQSPVIIQYSTPNPIQPVDGTVILNFDLYNNVLGYGRAQGSVIFGPDQDNPGKIRISSRNVFMFPAN